MKSINRKQLKISQTILILLVGVVLVACSPTNVTNDTDSESTSQTDPNVVTNIVWEWTTLKATTGFDNEAQRPIQEITTVPNPENYTLILREDGTFSGKADCNDISGQYKNEGGYSFTLGPSTMAACGEDSLDQQYLALLNRIVAGGPDGAGGFALETGGGAERMEFRNGSAAPAQ